MSDFFRPASIGEAVRILAEKQPGVIAGGTDMMIRLREGPRPAAIMDISGLDILKSISMNSRELVIGALVTHAELAISDEIDEFAPGLAMAARVVGSPQIRNMGTIGGNIANASPAADLLPPLYALNATVDILSAGGRRTIPVSEVFVGPKKTILSAEEIIGWIRIPLIENGVSTYARLGTRSALSISKVGIAIGGVLTKDGGPARLNDCRVALGSVAPTVIYAKTAMDILGKSPLTPETIEAAVRAAMEDASPIDDIRSTGEYRKSMVGVLVRRCLQGIATN